MASSSKSAEEVLAKADKAFAPSLLSFRLGPDVETAGPLFERASLLFKQASNLPRAISALERASQCQEKMGSPWHAGKHLEACATMSAASASAPSSSSSSLGASAAAAAADFARRAAHLYAEGGRAGAGAEALGRVAKLLEARGALREAAGLCDEALDMAEADGREGAGGGQSADLFRQAASLALSRGRWAEASSLFLRFGEACDRCGARASQARAYLGAVVALLHAGDAAAALATFEDVLPVGGGAFASSEEAGAARLLFDAYRGAGPGGEEAVRAAVARCGPTLRNLDAPAARLAVKLPAGGSDLAAMAAALGGGGGGGAAGGFGGGGDGEEEEEDLT